MNKFYDGGVFLKKFLALLISFCVVFLSGCVQRDLIDIYIFADRFCRHSENFAIDDKNLIAEENEEEIVFPLVFRDKILLSVRTNEGTSLITAFSVTYMFDGKRNISDEDFSSFLEIAESAVKSFTNLKNTDDIFQALSLIKKSDVMKDNHTSFEQGFYNFSFVSNELGLYFTASTERR